MKNRPKLNWQKQTLFAAIATLFFIFVANSSAVAQGKYKTGDRVECDTTESGKWFEKATVVPFEENDMYNGNKPESGYFYRLKFDRYGNVGFCKSEWIRRIAAPANQNQNGGNAKEKTPTTNVGTNQIQTENQGLKYKPGDRIECNFNGTGNYVRGTILPFLENDGYNGMPPSSGKWYRVDTDAIGGGSIAVICKIEEIRAITGTKPDRPPLEAKLRVDEDGTVLADRELLACPVRQGQVKNGARPDAKVLSKVITCLWEKPASKGLDGAVKMELTPLQIGVPRKWNPLNDIGNVPLNTVVYPVKTNFTWTYFYRTRNVVSEYSAVFNCWVNAFGEWQCGLSESKQKGDSYSITVKP